jgi:hypothetical protein
MEGGFTAPLEKLDGPLNELPPAEKRTPWSFTGEDLDSFMSAVDGATTS